MKSSSSFAQLVPVVEVTSQEVILDDRTISDLEMLLSGAFHPLAGFNTYEDFCSIVQKGQLKSGTVWPLPVLLPIPLSQVQLGPNADENVQQCNENTQAGGGRLTLKLRDQMNLILAELDVENFYKITHVDTVAKYLLGSCDPNHPYHQYLTSQGSMVYAGGNVRKIHEINHFDFLDMRLTPSQTKQMIADKGWTHVVGFQTRNPMHRSHFELTIKAMQKISAANGGERVHLLITPACGVTQHGDIPYHIRMRCYEKLLPAYAEYRRNKDYVGDVKIVLLPLSMRMAGPREALFHALIRENYGCTHFIVGRDHAGPSRRKADGTPFYGPYEAHEYIKSWSPQLKIQPVLGRNVVFVKQTTPQGERELFIEEDAVDKATMSENSISGTQLRKMLQNREPIPEWMTFSSVARCLQAFYKPYHELGFCMYFTGLPCSGKTTLALAVKAFLKESENEHRHVTFLDADIIRRELSKGLGFDRESRQLHVRRIGYVASLIVQSGGICLVANIAPYEEDREHNRQAVTATGGGFILVYLSTPLEVCEKRDVKGHYRNARLGLVKKFTGISDPYEVPANPELKLDSSENIMEKVNCIRSYLKQEAWIL